MIVPGSVVIAISYSGESRELVDLLRYCKSNQGSRHRDEPRARLHIGAWI